MAAVYLDSSALVKLAVREPESDALRDFLRRRRPWVSSTLARVEVQRAVLPGGREALDAGRRVLARCDLIRINDRVLDVAGSLSPIELRSLDAVHLATAAHIRDSLGVLVTYDTRMAEAAEQLGHRVTAPR